MTIVSKSGEADELTSATGRAEIWQYSMHLISERPLLGHGAATSKYYLADYSKYTHNLLLNIAFSTGIFGGLLGLVMVLYQSATVIFKTHAIVSAVIVYILVNGLFENVIFSTIAGMPTLLWAMSMAWYQVSDFNGSEHDTKPLSLRDKFA
jgi:O-antigen ligase